MSSSKRWKSRPRISAYVLVALAYVVALALVAAATFLIVLFVAGPHAGLLPEWLEAVVLALGWLVVIVVPIIAARAAWRRLAARASR